MVAAFERHNMDFIIWTSSCSLKLRVSTEQLLHKSIAKLLVKLLFSKNGQQKLIRKQNRQIDTKTVLRLKKIQNQQQRALNDSD